MLHDLMYMKCTEQAEFTETVNQWLPRADWKQAQVMSANWF